MHRTGVRVDPGNPSPLVALPSSSAAPRVRLHVSPSRDAGGMHRLAPMLGAVVVSALMAALYFGLISSRDAHEPPPQIEWVRQPGVGWVLASPSPAVTPSSLTDVTSDVRIPTPPITASHDDSKVKWLISSASSLPPTLAFCDSSRCTGQLKVISISLYGGNPRYTAGAVRNSEIVRDAFPDWQLWVYIPDASSNTNWEVPQHIKDTLLRNGAKLLVVDQATIAAVGFGMNQRFLIGEDTTVDRYIVRDGDSRLLLRERWAVDEWEESGKIFHVLRDHPSHSNFWISGGLWGALKGGLPNVKEMLARRGAKSDYLDDMNFLNSEVWPIMESKGLIQHDAFSCHRVGANAHPFPYKRAGGEHVGGVYDASDIIREGDVGLLLPAIAPPQCHSPEYPASDRYQFTPAEALRCAPVVHPNDPAAIVTDAPIAAPLPESFVGRDAITCADAVRYKNIGVVGAVTATRAPASGSDAIRTLPIITLLQYQKVFVDRRTATCTSGAPSKPAIFDYRRMLTWETVNNGCSARQPGEVRQYHERIEGGHTHYTALGPGGLKHHHHLLVLEAAYTGNPHVFAGLALPMILHYLYHAPRHAKILLPETPVVADIMPVVSSLGMHVAAASGVLRSSDGTPDANIAAAPPPNWKGSSDTDWPAWAVPHAPAPALYWAHRLYVAANAPAIASEMDVNTCGGVTCTSTSPEACWDTLAALAATPRLIDKALQRTLHASIQTTKACTATIVLPINLLSSDPVVTALTRVLEAAGFAPLIVDACHATPAVLMSTHFNSDVLVLPPNTLTAYAYLLRRTSTVLIVEDLVSGTSEPAGGELTRMSAVASVCEQLGCVHSALQPASSQFDVGTQQYADHLAAGLKRAIPSSRAHFCTANTAV